MRNIILTVVTLGMMGAMVSGCISGKKPDETYVGSTGTSTLIQSDREQCERACDADNTRCSETYASRSNSGINDRSDILGSNAECGTNLSSCMVGCRSR